MSDSEYLLTCVSILCVCLWIQVVRLDHRVMSLEENAALAEAPAGNPATLLDAKRAIERFREERAERSRA